MKQFFDQSTAPLLEGLMKYAARTRAREMIQFHMPGHRGGKGLAPLFRQLGGDLFSLDLTELREINYGHAPDFLLKAAERLAAEAFGAQTSFFLVNGASIGIAASFLGLNAPGREVIISRDCHLSVINGLILSGMKPRFISPRWIEGLPTLPTPEVLEEAILESPGAAGVFLTNPGYSGLYGPLAQVAEVVRRHNLPLLIDEAHGGHLRFFGVPEAAAVGADLWVWGFHKMLGSLTQTAMLHLGKSISRERGRLDPHRIAESLQILGTTSPSYLLLASLDSARRELFFHGERMFSKAARLGAKARRELRDIPGLRVFPAGKLPAGYGCDPTKVILSFRPLGLSSWQAEEILCRRFRIQPEYADGDYLYFFISYAQEEEEVDALIQACRRVAASRNGEKDSFSSLQGRNEEFTSPPWRNGTLELSPREAFQAPAAHISLKEAGDKIAASVVAAYPPGIPLWVPGERISPDLVEWGRTLQKNGGYLRGVDNGTIKIVADS